MFCCHIIIFLLAVGIYWNSLSGDFVHDDIVAIVRNPDVNLKTTYQSSLSESGDWWSLWKNDYWGMPMSSPNSHKSYRPLTVLTFRLNYWLCGETLCTEVFHGTNVVIHGLVSTLTMYLCRHVLQMKMTTSLFASAIFAIHPIHTEAVAGINGRADALACLFMLISFLIYHKSLQCESEIHSETFHDSNHNEYEKVTQFNKKFKCKNSIIQNLSESEINLKKNIESYSETDLSSSSAKTLALLFISGLVGFSAMLAKETGITVLGINLLYAVHNEFVKTTDYHGSSCNCYELDVSRKCESFMQKSFKLLQNPKLKQRIAFMATLVLVSLTFCIYLMNGSFPQFGRQDNPGAYSESILTRLLTFLYLPAFGTWLLLSPSNLSYDWQMGSIPLIESVLDCRNLFTLTFYISLVFLAKCASKTDRKNEKVVTICLLLIVLPFLPASNLFFYVGFVVAERVLYTPSLGFCILVAVGAERLWDVLNCSKLVKVLSVLVLLLPLGVRTWDRNFVWKSRVNLITSGIRDNPQNAKMHYNYANLQKDLGIVEKAIEHYSIAIRLWPEYPSAHNNLGTLLMSNPAAAEHQFRKAINISDGAHAGAYFNLGVLYMRQEKFVQAASHFNMSLKLDPSNHHAYQYFSLCISKQNNQTAIPIDVNSENCVLSQNRVTFKTKPQEATAASLITTKKKDIAWKNDTFSRQLLLPHVDIFGNFIKPSYNWKFEKVF